MPEQVSLSEFQSESYSLAGLRRQKEKAEQKELDDVTVTYEVGSPDTFSHSWTFQDVTTYEEYLDELRDTEDAALNRLANWHDREDSYSEDEVDLTPTDFPEEIEDFKQSKFSIDALDNAIERTEDVYDRTDDRGRNISIASKMNSQSDNLKQYNENLDKVEENLDFEDEMNLDEDGDVFDEDRTRTEGTEWVNKDGQTVRTLVFSTGVTFQIGGADGIPVNFDSKKKAKQYYKENRY